MAAQSAYQHNTEGNRLKNKQFEVRELNVSEMDQVAGGRSAQMKKVSILEELS